MADDCPCPCVPDPVPQKQNAAVSLSAMKPGQTGVIDRADLPPADRAMLRAMGMRDHAKVVLCRMGEPCIVRVMGGCGCSSRIGLSRPLADKVFVGLDGA